MLELEPTGMSGIYYIIYIIYIIYYICNVVIYSDQSARVISWVIGFEHIYEVYLNKNGLSSIWYLFYSSQRVMS